MADFGIVIVSHSEKLAEGLAELVEEMNDGSVLIKAAGGTGDGRIGTNSLRVQAAIEALEDCNHILIYCDLGSAVLSAETAIDLVDEDLAEKVQIVDTPVVEGAFAGVVHACVCNDVNEVVNASCEARHLPKG